MFFAIMLVDPVYTKEFKSYRIHRYNKSAISCLATMVYHEARGTDKLTKIKTINVVLNRVHNRNYPSTICGVIYQKTRYRNKVVCQFSWSCKKHLYITDKRAYKSSMEVAQEVMLNPEKQKFKHIMHFRSRGKRLMFKP